MILAAALGGGGTAATEAKKGRQTGSSRAATAVRESLELTGFKYYCAVCNVGMGKLKNFEQHVNGKSHEANVKVARHPHPHPPEPTTSLPANPLTIPRNPTNTNTANNIQAQTLSEARFRSSAPTWVVAADPEAESVVAESGAKAETMAAVDAEGGISAAVVQNVGVAWQPSELSDFPMRATCLCPSTTINDLTPELKARLWRYLSDIFGKHYPEMVEVIHHMDVTNGR